MLGNIYLVDLSFVSLLSQATENPEPTYDLSGCELQEVM